VTALPEWDDDLADLLAMVTVAREDAMTPAGREAPRALGENCDSLGVIAAAIKLLAELASDAGLCPDHFREYAVRAIARLSRSRRRAGDHLASTRLGSMPQGPARRCSRSHSSRTTVRLRSIDSAGTGGGRFSGTGGSGRPPLAAAWDVRPQPPPPAPLRWPDSGRREPVSEAAEVVPVVICVGSDHLRAHVGAAWRAVADGGIIRVSDRRSGEVLGWLMRRTPHEVAEPEAEAV